MDLVYRPAALYILIFVITRVIGRRELSSLAPFDIILLIVIGDAIQQGLTQDDYSLTGAFIGITTFIILQMAASSGSSRGHKAGPILKGEPIVLIQDGTL